MGTAVKNVLTRIAEQLEEAAEKINYQPPSAEIYVKIARIIRDELARSTL